MGRAASNSSEKTRCPTFHCRQAGSPPHVGAHAPPCDAPAPTFQRGACSSANWSLAVRARALLASGADPIAHRTLQTASHARDLLTDVHTRLNPFSTPESESLLPNATAELRQLSCCRAEQPSWALEKGPPRGKHCPPGLTGGSRQQPRATKSTVGGACHSHPSQGQSQQSCPEQGGEEGSGRLPGLTEHGRGRRPGSSSRPLSHLLCCCSLP